MCPNVRIKPLLVAPVDSMYKRPEPLAYVSLVSFSLRHFLNLASSLLGRSLGGCDRIGTDDLDLNLLDSRGRELINGLLDTIDATTTAEAEIENVEGPEDPMHESPEDALVDEEGAQGSDDEPHGRHDAGTTGGRRGRLGHGNLLKREF